MGKLTKDIPQEVEIAKENDLNNGTIFLAEPLMREHRVCDTLDRDWKSVLIGGRRD